MSEDVRSEKSFNEEKKAKKLTNVLIKAPTKQ